MSFLKTTKFWTIVGGVFAFLSFVYIIYVDQSIRPKGLAAGLISVSTLLNEKVRNDGRSLQVLFGSEPVKYFAIARVSVKNTGGSQIVASDFEGRLIFQFKNVRKIYFIDLKDRTPKDLNPAITYNPTSIEIDPLLLNSGDAFDIDVGIDIDSDTQLPTMETKARIAGIKEVSSLEFSRKDDKKDRNFFLILLIASAAVLASAAVVAIINATWRGGQPDRYREMFDKLIKGKGELEIENLQLRGQNLELEHKNLELHQQLIRTMHKPKPSDT